MAWYWIVAIGVGYLFMGALTVGLFQRFWYDVIGRRVDADDWPIAFMLWPFVLTLLIFGGIIKCGALGLIRLVYFFVFLFSKK